MKLEGATKQGSALNVSVCFTAADIFEMGCIGAKYGFARASLVRTVMRRFMSLPTESIRAWLLEDELVEKKGRLVAEKKKLDAALALVEKDLGACARGCDDASHLKPRNGGGTGPKQGAASKGG